MVTLVDVHYVSGPNAEGQLPACQSCGHAILCLCTVRLDNGHEMVVGTDCATSLLGKDSDLQRHARQAAREWTKKTPPAREGEERATYINRRIGEKLAARKAWDHWQRFCGGHWYEVVRRLRAARARIVELAQEYREACDANDGLLATLMQGDENTAPLRDAEHRSWETMEQRREALFGALEELEQVEGEAHEQAQAAANAAQGVYDEEVDGVVERRGGYEIWRDALGYYVRAATPEYKPLLSPHTLELAHARRWLGDIEKEDNRGR